MRLFENSKKVSKGTKGLGPTKRVVGRPNLTIWPIKRLPGLQFLLESFYDSSWQDFRMFFLWKKELKLRWNHHVRDVISYVIVFICQFRSKHCLTYILQRRTVIRYWEEVFKKYRVLRRCHSVFIWSLLNMKPDFLSAGILLWLSCLFICVK